MTPLHAIIARRILADGPMSIADYMALALAHPEHGYYQSRNPFGEAGDFVTAPEISQMFGELLGLWFATVWQASGAPDRFALVELGPGRGTAMRDMLHATARVPGFDAAAEVWLVETSPALRRQQRTLLGDRPRWADAVAELPEIPLFVLANEFFDALPIRQFQRDRGRWCERMVGLQDGALRIGLSPPLDLSLGAAPDGTIREISAPAMAIATEIGTRIAAQGGAMLAIDYGGWDGQGDTLQAVRAHQPVDPLQDPGLADLTAHVDFAALAHASGLPVTGYTTQGALLASLGIGQRAATLAAKGDADSIAAALRRLTDPDEMGEVFKALALLPAGSPPPPGF